MRSRLALASASVGLVLVVGACTNILGTFTVGDGGAPPDANDDAPSDAASDAPEDSPADSPTPVDISCQESKNTRTALTSGGALHAEQLRMGAIPNNRLRIIVPDVQQSDASGFTVVVHAYTVDSSHNSTAADLSTGAAAKIYSITRYGGGFAVLFQANDPQTGKPYLWAAHIDDNTSSWNPAVELVESPNQTAGASDGATFVAMDASNDRYMVAYTYASGSTQYVFLGPLGPNESSMFGPAENFPTNVTDQESYMFAEPGIAFQPGNPPMAIMAPNGNMGPPPQGTPLRVVAPNNTGFMLTPPSNLNYFPYAFAPSASSQTKADLAMLIANLTTFQGGTYVGQVDYSAFKPSFNPQTFTETALTSDGGTVHLDDLFIGNPNAHWDVASGSTEQLIMLGPPFDPLQQATSNGFNFAWWDGPTGANHVYDTGADALGQDITNVAVVDGTFQTLVASIAAFQVAYVSDVAQPTEGGGGQPVAGDLYVTSIACQPK